MVSKFRDYQFWLHLSSLFLWICEAVVLFCLVYCYVDFKLTTKLEQQLSHHLLCHQNGNCIENNDYINNLSSIYKIIEIQQTR